MRTRSRACAPKAAAHEGSLLVSAQNPAAAKRPRSFTAISIDLFERLMPDAFVLAIALTALVAVAAEIFASRGTPAIILTSWYAGTFNILGFAFQMILILVTGHALAYSPPVQRGLKRLISAIRTPNQAVTVTFLVAAVASWINWGFGLVIGAVLAREVAKQVRVDFAWLVAAAYSGFVIYASGPWGSIPLSQASAGNVLNIVEKITGHIVPFSQSIFALFNVVPTVLVFPIMPFVFILVRPGAEEMQFFVPPAESIAPTADRTPMRALFARRIERSPLGSLFLAAAGIAYVAVAWTSGQLTVDINLVIFLFLIAGLALHGSPLNYADAVKNAAKQTGSMMLQYPVYGGIMGIITAPGPARAHFASPSAPPLAGR